MLTDLLNPYTLMHLALRIRAESEFILFQDQRLTRRQVFIRVKQLAAGLQALGIQEGDRVATLLPACPEAVYSIFLRSMLGSVNVPLNPLLGEHELRHILADCGAKVVITTRNWYGLDHPALLTRLLPDLPALRYILVRQATADVGQTFDHGQMVLPLDEVMSIEKPLRRVKVSAEDIALILYTSGSTGKPKGVAHNSRSWSRLLSSAGRRLNLSPLRCLLLPFPPFQLAGTFGIMVALLSGGKVILMERFDPRQVLETIQTEKVTQMGGSPTMYRLLLLTPGQEDYDLSSLKRVTFSTEPMPFDLVQALHERLHCNLENFYSTTECMLISWTGMNDSWERAATTVGKPAPGVQVRIVDDKRQQLPVGERGEIAVRAPHLMMGYFKDPELTAQVLDEGGWFYTGDIGYFDKDGYLRLVDRKKDLIIRGGQNIYPLEIEQFLERHPAIRRAAVIGVPSAMGGEAVWAYLELQPGAKISSQEVMDFCRGQIAPFKIPEQIRFVERLPTTASNKIQKFVLRETAAQELSTHAIA